jgi:hypothetical protein
MRCEFFKYVVDGGYFFDRRVRAYGRINCAGYDRVCGMREASGVMRMFTSKLSDVEILNSDIGNT